MKKYLPCSFLFFMLLFCWSPSVFAQSEGMSDQDVRLKYQAPVPTNADNSVVALWDLEFDFAVDTLDLGSLAPGVHFNDEFWMAEWNSAEMLRLDETGQLIESFTIPTLTDVRSMTWDGTSLWMGNNSQTVYQVDPATKNVLNTVNFDFPDNVRFVAFDETADGGAGGLWVGNFNTDISLFSLDGTLLETIPQATHGLGGMYGAAFDNQSEGGPYLWVFHQAGGVLDGLITQLKMPEGTPTGVGRDVQLDLGTEGGLAGGMFITNDWNDDGTPVLGGVLQTGPDRLFGYDLEFEVGPIVNAGATAIIEPNIACGLTDAENVIVTIENNGLEDIMDLSVSLMNNGTILVTEIIPSVEAGAAFDYTFDMPIDFSTTGPYNLSVMTSIAGDVNNSNDMVKKFVANKAFAFPPFNSSFDDFDVDETVFINLYNVGDIPFQVNEGDTPSINTGPVSDILNGAGRYVYMETSGRDRGEQAILTTNCLDLTNVSDAELTYGYHAYGDGIEYLRVDVTNQSGIVTNLQLFEGQQQMANDDSWALEFLDLSSFEGQIIEVSWIGEIGEDGSIFNCDIALDEISMTGTVVNTNEIEILEAFAVSPNPTQDKINIAVALEREQAATLTMFNTIGQPVFVQNEAQLLRGTYELAAQDFPAGIYHLQLLVNGKIAMRKVVIQ